MVSTHLGLRLSTGDLERLEGCWCGENAPARGRRSRVGRRQVAAELVVEVNVVVDDDVVADGDVVAGGEGDAREEATVVAAVGEE